MTKRPPHILVTTPESLFILLTSEGGRQLLRTVRTAIVDEIHAMLGDKRGAHLALSMERLEHLGARASGPHPLLDAVQRPAHPGHPQRIGLSATQKPIEDVARFLVGTGRECTPVDIGHRRAMDIAIEVPSSPLAAVCSHEVWDEIYDKIAAHIEAHRTTLVFTGTRKLAERVSARLQARLGEEAVTCHHSSLSKERRLDAETRLKEGRLRALVATASLELGIDIGDIDLVIQVGATRSIATFLQRVGRAGHTLARIPKGRILPLTASELVDATAILRAVRRGILDRTPQPTAPLDILAQQIVAACAAESFAEDDLFAIARRAWPYRDLDRAHFEALLALHAHGRNALLHRDGVHGRVRGTRRARLTAITSGGAIPDRADYRVHLEPEGTFIGTIDEDFAIEASAGDIFQLGSTSWQILRVEPGIVHVGDAKGVPPNLPFWFGEALARTDELSHEVGEVREHGHDRAWLERECGIPPEAAEQLAEFLAEGRRALGTVPTPRRIVVERFFDESGGQQMVVHAVLGGRINRAWGLSLRKKFCRNFGFELQAAANEDAFLLSLGLQHAFPLDEIFAYLRPETLEATLSQAILPLPMFKTRWRWNAQRALLLPRMRGGKKVPPPIQRMRAEDLLAQAFPEVLACGETLPPGDFPIPGAEEQPLVAQTVEDCLRVAMDVDGARAVLEGIASGAIETVAVDVPEPSVFAHSILNAAPYAFLDDAPLEERRAHAVLTRRALDDRTADTIGALDPEAVRRVREEAWPDPRDEEEMHEVLLWIGYVTDEEAATGWLPWLEHLAASGRASRDPVTSRWFAAETDRDPQSLLRGRLDALGPVRADDETLPLLRQLEGEGAVMRIRLEGAEQWCERRLLARIQRSTLESLREQIRPVSAADWLRFLAEWQHVAPGSQLEGP
jgi:ATP-dependent Lhr-like helicase